MVISADELKARERALRYKSQLARPEVFPSRENWEYIIANNMGILAPLLYRKYLVATLTAEQNRGDFQDAALEMFPRYLESIPREDAMNAVYADFESNEEATVEIIHKARLFNAPRLLDMLYQGFNPGLVARCLSAYQPEYQPEDIKQMSKLSDAMAALPSMGDIRESRSIFGTDIKYVCPNGHASNSQNEFCPQCGLNIQGLDAREAEAVDDYRKRVKILEKMFEEGRTL